MPFGLTCEVCEQPFTFFENLNFTLRALGRCTECDQRLQAAVANLLAGIEEDFKLPAGITGEIEYLVVEEIERLQLPSDLEEPLTERLDYLRLLTRIREGDFPHIAYDGHLETDEYAHWYVPATYINQQSKKTKKVPGKLLLTTRKVYFLPESGIRGHELGWNNVKQAAVQTLRIEEEPHETLHHHVVILSEDEQSTTYQVLRVRVTAGSGGGDYAVADPLLAKTFIDALGQQWRRQLANKRSASKYVPDAIKAVVHQRDGGCCVECGYTGPYIEFDHIWPRSKGGFTTVDNLQLLCGQCNRKKGNRI